MSSAGNEHCIYLHDATAGYFAARAPQMLPALNRRLTANFDQPDDLRIRTEISLRKRNWTRASTDVRKFLSLKPHLRWFMTDCAVASPYPYDFTQSHAAENSEFYSFESPEDHGVELSADVHWRSVPRSFQGVVDFDPFTDLRDHVLAYASYRIYSPDNQRVAILLGSDDGARLWLKGERLYEALGSRDAVPEQDAVAAMLKAGWNALLVRVSNENGHHSLHLSLSESEADLARVSAQVK